ncbi:arsenate reductase ArsC [Granulosicoccaceae sp. 1_MG-2023]|nr:arsenate reductase ArsC [Granulosicoccaceae sp. 1_MG-2023]
MNILFLCTHNACRSVLAESIARHTGVGLWQVASAGSHPAGRVHPDTLAALREKGLPTDGLSSQSWDELSDFQPDVVITVCDQAAGETCPVWFGKAVKAHWGLPDPTREDDDSKRRQRFDEVISTLERRLQRLAQFISKGAASDRDALQAQLTTLKEIN